MRYLLLLALLPLFVSAAPVLKDKPTLYYATDVGTALEYETKIGEKTATTTETISAVATKDGQTFVTVVHTRAFCKGPEQTTRKYQISERGIVLVGTDDNTIDKPVPLLKLPSKPNETWPVNQNEKATTCTTIGEAEITVPAGKYKAIGVEHTFLNYKRTFWCALDNGVVKVIWSFGDMVTRVQVLTSLTKPKK